MNKKKALVTGITGQDGSYLSELLLDKGYEVHGIIRRSSTSNTGRIDHLCKNSNYIHLHYGDLTDANSLNSIVNEVKPVECYNLAAQSHVKVSFEKPEYTANVTGVGTLRMLESIKMFSPECRFYQASSSELFGVPYESPQNELTRIHPRSPYGVAKQFGYSMTINYRESYGIHASNGILYNHESPRRGETFVTRKITMAVASIKLGLQDYLSLGNIHSRRDWGYAPDFIKAMWLMLQQEKPDDYVISTGETHSIKEFVDIAFNLADIELIWEGEGENEVGIEKSTGRVLVKVDPKYYRPAEVVSLLGDYSKANRVLGWEPKVKFEDLVQIMYESDYSLVRSSNKEEANFYNVYPQ